MNDARMKRIEKRLAALGMVKGLDCSGVQFCKHGKIVDAENGKGQTFVFAKGQEEAMKLWQAKVKKSSIEVRLFVDFVSTLLSAINNTGSEGSYARHGRKPLATYFLPLFEKALPHLNVKHRSGLLASGRSKAHSVAYMKIESMVEQWDKWAK